MRKNDIIRLSFQLLLVFHSLNIFAEGTPQLRPTSKDSAAIKLINTVSVVVSTGFALYNDTSTTKYKMYVHVCDLTEKVLMGFNLGSDPAFDVSVIVIAPNGSIAFPLTVIPKLPGPGFIATYAQAVAGPNTIPAGAAAGYSPFSFTPLQLGDYSVEFKINKLPSTGSLGGRANTFIKYFDVTVVNSTNVPRSGRLWSTAWDITVQQASNTFNGSFFAYSSDRIVSKVTMNGMIPLEFIFSANNTGVKSTGDPIDNRKSVKGNTTYPLYPVFLNNPDISCYPTGTFGKVISAPAIGGCPGNYCFNVNVSATGQGTIYMELNGSPGFQSGTRDRALLKLLTAGANCIPWDGKDGKGGVVTDSSLSFDFNYQNGITHIPMFDVEKNPIGFTVAYARPIPSIAKPIELFWDDSKLGGIVTTTPCSGACHTWTGIGTGDIGNNNTINTWWVGGDTSISKSLSLLREVHANRQVVGKGKSNDTSICSSLKTILLKASSKGVPSVKWRVLTGSGLIANDTSLTTSYALSPADVQRQFIQLELSSFGDGCIPVKDSIKYMINPLPIVTASPKDPYSCVGYSITLSGGGALTYKWDNGIVDNTPFMVNVTKRYTVTGIDSKGCQDTASTLVKVNTKPNLKLSVRGDTVCSSPNNVDPVITIQGAQEGIIYEARMGSSVGPLLGTDTPTTSGTLLIPINRLLLTTIPGNNTVYITAALIGCGTFTLDSTANVRINKLPDSTTSFIATSPVCLGGTSIVSIIKSQAGVAYSIYENSLPITTIIGNGDTAKIGISMNVLGARIIRIKADVYSCAQIELANKPVVQVNSGSDILLGVKSTTPICLGDTSIVTVEKAQNGVVYQVFEGIDPLSTTQIGSDVDLSFSIIGLSKGTHLLRVIGTTGGCGPVELFNKPIIVVNGPPSITSVTVEGSSVCPGESAIATLTNTEIGTQYNLYLNGKSTGLNVIGTAGIDTLDVPMNFITDHINRISFTAGNQACNIAELADMDTIYKLDKNGFNLLGDNLLCFGGTGYYSTNGTVGALSYQWEVGDSAFILSGQGTKNLEVKFDSISSSVSIFPVGIYGICPTLKIELPVVIKAPITGSAFIKAKDTVCVGQIDTVLVSGQKGVYYYDWVFPSSVQLLDTIKTDSASQLIVVKYTQPGYQPIIALPFSECAGSFGDTIKKTVHVLGFPVAEANEYPIKEMLGAVEAIPLNGKGSTLTGIALADTITYLWYAEKGTQAQLNNPTSLNGASVTTSSKQVKVFLKVSNMHGYCPAVDSAIITILFDLNIPNVFTPNGDGTHDMWEIKNITTFYPNATVEVFNQWGSFIWRSNPGYTEPWDGKRHGEDLPVATYYFILDKKTGAKPIVGPITILK